MKANDARKTTFTTYIGSIYSNLQNTPPGLIVMACCYTYENNIQKKQREHPHSSRSL